MTKIILKLFLIISFLLKEQFITALITELYKLLAKARKDINKQKNWKQKYPNYEDFFIDPTLPLTRKKEKQFYYKDLIDQFFKKYNKELKPVNYRKNTQKPSTDIECPHCQAPHEYLYLNNGKKGSQFLCKVCNKTFAENLRTRSELICPYCNGSLILWKIRDSFNIYKCYNNNCPEYLKNKSKLSKRELKLYDTQPYRFKLRYHYREYTFTAEELNHASPSKPVVNINKIHNSKNILGLVLTFYVSFAISARKTAEIMKHVFRIPISYQTVINYAEAASYYCHNFNFKYKGPIDNIQAGDETYIKILGKNHYVFFFISPAIKNITAYHIADTRSTLPAIISMMEAKRTASKNQKVNFVTDGNPSYTAAYQYICMNYKNHNISDHTKVIGLKNLDKESKEYRPYKQIIERLNRTYKYHCKSANDFKKYKGAIALTALFVTHYNFIRQHRSLYNKPPVMIPELNGLDTIQAKWIKIISMGFC